MTKAKAKLDTMGRLEALLSEWHEAQKSLTQVKLREQELRQQIFQLAFPNPERGSNYATLPYNMVLIGRPRHSYSVDADKLSELHLPDEMLQKVIRYRPEVREAAYVQLPMEAKAILSEAVTEKPGLPSIEIKPADKVRR